MHYKNGREAKPGDRVISLEFGVAGILHSLAPGSTTCNGRIAPTSQNDPYVTLSDCVHIDDVKVAAPQLADCSGEKGDE
jgi:hypothetical protein